VRAAHERFWQMLPTKPDKDHFPGLAWSLFGRRLKEKFVKQN
jgi:hypothetical protein